MTTAVLDACVLHSAPLRDLFMHLTVHFVFQPKWTERIHAEWMASLLRRRPDLSPVALARTRDLMNEWARDWQPPPYEALLPLISLPDPDDRHVVAAAVASGARIIVTFNLSDFPASVLARHGLQAQHPDEFAIGLLAANQAGFLEAVRTHRAALLHPPMTVEGYLDCLRASGLTNTSARLAEHEAII